ncbi:magnesium transporter CorA [Gordonibacter sp. An230]|uniref:magnesium transporter CorA family protein n=1 Tax=Gordonibacter sp. An230 TaxID=1965592 RepID=UPI000B3A0542|nr:CorA family divalent cation transporter [Gordonibacter sp. An230]OUO91285.1 magnesium transporter CorA [Gordonibacter sp. An230]
MSHAYVLTNRFEPVPANEAAPPDRPVVEALTSRELASLGLADKDTQEALHLLATAENTYLDALPRCFVGSFAVPDKAHLSHEPFCFAFYLDKSRLVLLDEGDTCARMLDDIAQQDHVMQPTAAHCLLELMKLLVKDDLTFLANLEDRMEDVEESIIDRGAEGANKQMLAFRRKLLRIDTYYQQLVDMASTLAENESKLLTQEESHLFHLFERQAERLLKRSLTLKEYSLQLRELYQTHIDIKQNDTMRFFTVITTLFAPLTLLTSWFGMNFTNMPELDWKGGYPAVIGVSLGIVAVELVVFKRKHWL